MTRRVLLLALAVALGPAHPVLSGARTPIQSSSGTACTNLAAMTVPGISVRSAAQVAAGPFTPPGSRQEMTLAAFCRVEAVARPTSDSEIKVEVWIARGEAWEGQVEGGGNGRCSGRLSYGGG